MPHVTVDENGNPTNVRIIARMSAFPTVNPNMFCSKWQRKLEVAGCEIVDLVEAQRNRD